MPMYDSQGRLVDLGRALREIYVALDEQNPDAHDCIWRVSKAKGIDFVRDCVARAMEVHAQGGLERPNGAGPRTLGGVLFVVLKETMGIEAYREVTLTRYRRLVLRREKFRNRYSQSTTTLADSMTNEPALNSDH
jgi:hypothetical protein